MENINIKENVKTTELTAREQNFIKGDTFIKRNDHIREEALRRLQDTREYAAEYQRAINAIGTQDMPLETLELYEEFKIVIRKIEAAEMKTAMEG